MVETATVFAESLGLTGSEKDSKVTEIAAQLLQRFHEEDEVRQWVDARGLNYEGMTPALKKVQQETFRRHQERLPPSSQGSAQRGSASHQTGVGLTDVQFNTLLQAATTPVPSARPALPASTASGALAPRGGSSTATALAVGDGAQGTTMDVQQIIAAVMPAVQQACISVVRPLAQRMDGFAATLDGMQHRAYHVQQHNGGLIASPVQGGSAGVRGQHAPWTAARGLMGDFNAGQLQQQPGQQIQQVQPQQPHLQQPQQLQPQPQWPPQPQPQQQPQWPPQPQLHPQQQQQPDQQNQQRAPVQQQQQQQQQPQQRPVQQQNQQQVQQQQQPQQLPVQQQMQQPVPVQQQQPQQLPAQQQNQQPAPVQQQQQSAPLQQQQQQPPAQQQQEDQQPNHQQQQQQPPPLRDGPPAQFDEIPERLRDELSELDVGGLLFWCARGVKEGRQVCNLTQQRDVMRLIAAADLAEARVIVADALFRFMKAQPSVDETEAQTWVWTLAEMEGLLAAPNVAVAARR